MPARTPAKPCARCGRKLTPKRQRFKYCYTCNREVKREQTRASHDAYVQKTYGLLPGEYDRLYEAQGGTCYICRRATGRTRRLAVDHDHAIGDGNRDAVRGLLCKSDNRMLGFARDDPEFFERAAEYLRNPPARKVLD